MPGPNRRAVVGVIGASPILPALGPIGAHEAVALSAAWLATGRQVDQLTHRWQAIETEMMRAPAWAALSREHRRFFPAQVQLAEIDDLKDAVHDRQHDLLEQLVLAPTKDVSGALGKLSVVMGVMYADDYPHCYDLIMDSAKTLAGLTCPHCNKPLARSEAAEMVDQAVRTWNIPSRSAK
jgi:hypothetical protein